MLSIRMAEAVGDLPGEVAAHLVVEERIVGGEESRIASLRLRFAYARRTQSSGRAMPRPPRARSAISSVSGSASISRSSSPSASRLAMRSSYASIREDETAASCDRICACR